MKQFRKLKVYIARHADFIILDMLTFIISYVTSIKMRKLMHMSIWHEELFLKFAVVGLAVYIVVELLNQNLTGIVERSVPEEIMAVGKQMILTWSVYTFILFLMKEAHEFSRMVYITAFGFCFMGLLIMRTIWKAVVRYTGISKKLLPGIAVVAEGKRYREIIDRILPGSLENAYEIKGIITTGESDYNDWYPRKEGIEQIPEAIDEWKIREAYVEIDDAEAESAAINSLLSKDVVVHRSLKESRFDYASQHINTFGGKAVITIDDVRASRLFVVKRIWEKIIWKKDNQED